MNTFQPPAHNRYQYRPERLECVNPDKAPYRFCQWNDAARRHLIDQGFVVIANILQQTEIYTAKSLLWEFLKELGWKRTDPSTWQTDLINPKGILWGNGAGQSALMWYLRTRTRVVQTFAAVWSSPNIYSAQGRKFDYKQDMLTSMDGFGVFRPWYLHNRQAWKTQSGWYHIDQNIAAKPHLETIQGIISLYPQNASTGSTVFVPGSHRWVQTVVPELSKYRKDFVMIKPQKIQNRRKILLCCNAGDLILWDSRLIHCNSPAILSLSEMQRVHELRLKERANGMKPKQMNDDSKETKNDSQENDDETEEEKAAENSGVVQFSSKTEKHFVESMKDNYLKPKVTRNLNEMRNKMEYNGYILEVIEWKYFNPKYFSDGKAYYFKLPWNTSLIWIPNWLDKITSNNLKKLITDKIEFQTPTLRFDKTNKHGQVVGVTEIKQNRKTAWVCNDFNQCVQNRPDTDILPAIPLETWSECLLQHASKTAHNEFNAMLLIHYLNGKNSIGLHSDDDYGLGNQATIGSLSLGSKRTFFIKSKQMYGRTQQKIELRVPLTHGSFVVMNNGFQQRWLHSIPKEKDVIGDRINVTFRRYALQTDRINGNSKQSATDLVQDVKKIADVDTDVDDVNVPSVLRAVGYVCMVPKVKVKSVDVIQKRIAAFETWSTCSHSPNAGAILHKPRGLNERSIESVQDEMVKSLIGVDMLTDDRYQQWRESQSVHGNAYGRQSRNNDNNNNNGKRKRWRRRSNK